MGPAKRPPMLNFFGTWNTVQRQQRALFRALAQWQNDPERELGDFGLSVTTEITNPRSDAISIQFTLHHSRGGSYDSGLVTIGDEPDAGNLGWLPEVASPLLSEFLLPSGIAGDFHPFIEPETQLRIVAQ
jgi:hypothetical protein